MVFFTAGQVNLLCLNLHLSEGGLNYTGDFWSLWPRAISLDVITVMSKTYESFLKWQTSEITKEDS